MRPNIYLDALDQFIKHELGVEAYIRYMDDFVILSPDKEQLKHKTGEEIVDADIAQQMENK